MHHSFILMVKRQVLNFSEYKTEDKILKTNIFFELIFNEKNKYVMKKLMFVK